MTHKILVLAGDGIGPEVMAEAEKLLRYLVEKEGVDLELIQALAGGAAIEATGKPLPDATLTAARDADAILLGAVGDSKYDGLDFSQRPERALLGLRSELDLFANLRPALLSSHLADASPLRHEVIAGLDIMIVRELTGGIYFGEPRGVHINEKGERVGINTLVYSESEIVRIAKAAFEIAMRRGKRMCSVDKSNVLEATVLWREVVTEVSSDYPEVELSHMLADNAGMQLVANPKQFDVIVTTNMFGDILSDLAAMSTGSIGMLPSASLNESGFGMYEPVHGTAPDIAGKNIANPLATLLSVAMMFRYTLNGAEIAERIDAAVDSALARGLRTGDIAKSGEATVGTSEMGDAVVELLASGA